MCGIAGFLDFTRQNPSELLRTTVKRMGDTLRHRGPDDVGTWVDAYAGIALAHRRLSILDVSPAGQQPMLSGSGRFVIVYNGEIYNFQELREELEKSNSTPPRFRGHSDTEVLLACFDCWGIEPTLPRLNGMFAFALWDRQDRILYLGRDRLGEKPVYYGSSGKIFLFGSELKALRAHPDFRAEINRDAVALYLRYNCIPTPHSIYRGVYKLPPGTLLAVNSETPPDTVPISYWSVRKAVEAGIVEPFRGSVVEVLEQLEALLRDAVKIRMVADVPLGTFLSGGIDSSTVVALMQCQSPRPVKTFTIGLCETAYNEANDARAVAEHLGTEHTELYVTPKEALAVIQRLPVMFDEPFADSSQIPTFLVSQLARRHVTVSLSGDGGDEVFGGYNRHVWSARIWRALGWLPKKARWAAASMINRISPQSWDSFFEIFEPFLPEQAKHRTPGYKLHKLAAILRLTDFKSTYLESVSHWANPGSIVIGAQEPGTLLTTAGACANLSALTEQMMFLDTLTYLPDDILTKVDRASMANSLEARVPMLDHRVVEFAWRIPISMKVRNGQGKWILRQLLYRYVPSRLINRPKSGFGVPLDIWLRGPLRDWAESLLDERRIRSDGFFNPEPIRKKWAEHLSGAATWQDQLWGVLMFQAWCSTQQQSQTEMSTSVVAAS